MDWNPRYLYDKYFGDAEQSQWFLDNICLYSWNLQMDGGKPFAEGVKELQAEHPEWSEAIGIYHTRWVEMMGGEVAGTADVLRSAKAAGYKIYGLTNWSAETFPMIRDTYPVFQEFDGIVVSGEEHLLKPDAAIYRCLLERTLCEPRNHSLSTIIEIMSPPHGLSVWRPCVSKMPSS